MFKYIKGKWGDEISLHAHEETIVISSSGKGFTFMHVMEIDQATEFAEHLIKLIEIKLKEKK